MLLLAPLLVTSALAVPPPPAAMRGEKARPFHSSDPEGSWLRAPHRLPAPPDAVGALGGWDVQHVELRVRIDPEARTVVGRARLEVARLPSGGALVLHAAGPVVGAVTLNGAPVVPTVAGDELSLGEVVTAGHDTHTLALVAANVVE